MAFPILPLLVGGGLLGAQNFFANNAQASNSFLDRAFNIDRSGQQLNATVDALAEQIPEGQRQATDPVVQSLFGARQLNRPSLVDQAIRIQEERRVAELQRQQQLADRLYNDTRADQQRSEQFARADLTELSNDYQQDLNSFSQLQQSWDSLRGALEGGTAQDAFAATFQIAKILDPTSVVRQEEGRAIIEAEGLARGLVNTINKLAGEGWTDTTRKQWFETMRRIYAPKAQNAGRRIQFYQQEAERRKVAPESFVGRLGIDRSRLETQAPFNPTPGQKTPQEVIEENNLTVIGEF